MDRTYIEVLVARGQNTAAGLGKIIFGILAGLSLVMMIGAPIMIVLAAVFAGASYYCYMQEWVEYEYTYISRELTVDKIMARSKRKQVAAYLLDKMEIGAPEKSYRLDGWRSRKCSVKDYSSKTGKPVFVIYYEGNKKIVLEADEGLMQMLRNAAPSKMFLD